MTWFLPSLTLGAATMTLYSDAPADRASRNGHALTGHAAVRYDCAGQDSVRYGELVGDVMS
ncbi:MAG: hypothetical protein QOJ11_3868 [Frankiales bacterium]|nr:hypothetical protein [Frankiales bacterium]